jgi:nicotinamide phosphoribosyltransferase
MLAPRSKFDASAYEEARFAFPEISFGEFQKIGSLDLRKEIAGLNKILLTDTYNRTMAHTRGARGKKAETYTMTFRKSLCEGAPIIVYGVRNIVKRILARPITSAELEFAREFFEDQAEKGGNGYFDYESWKEVVEENGGYLPIEVRAVEDGTAVRPGEPVLSVTGPGEMAAHFEPIFLRLFYQSAVATQLRVLEEILGSGRVVEFGSRSAWNNATHFDALEALAVGGGLVGTSDDAGAAALPGLRCAGTIAHRFLASYPTEEEGFREAIEKNEKIALLIDLIEPYRGIDRAVRLKKEYRASGKPIWMRLDSGDLAAQAVYALEACRENGMLDPALDKIVVADISSVADVIRMEETVTAAGFDPKKFLVYGLGGLLVATGKTRDALSAAFKLTETIDGGTGKLSADEAKAAYPGKLNVEIREGERVTVNEAEEVRGKRLLKTVYRNGKTFFKGSDLEAVEAARERVKSGVAEALLPSRKSKRVERDFEAMKERFLKMA